MRLSISCTDCGKQALIEALRITAFTMIAVVVACSTTAAQTVVKVLDGVTVGLDSGDIVKLKGLSLSQDKTTRDRSRKLLVSFVLDRPVTLEDSVDLGWGKIEAVVKWRGVDIGQQLKQKGVVVAEGVSSQQPSVLQQQSIPQQNTPAPPARYYYVPQPQPQYRPSYYQNGFSSYTPSSAYCVGNT